MDFEKEIFQKCIIDFKKLESYGFKKDTSSYIYSQNILDNTFKVIITVNKDKEVQGQIIDLSLNEEYVNYRVKAITGEFVGRVREEYKSILQNIKEKCTTSKCFLFDQANRLANFIIQKHGDEPAFVWDKFPGYGLFKNPQNNKWYALIANIDKGKITKGKGEVEVLNVKLDKAKVSELLKKKGFYKAYHMNKDSWISIILDDTVPDEEIVKYIEESHSYTVKTNKWLVPANPKYYDVIGAFETKDIINWKQSSNVNVGDLVYLYVASPYSAILYECEALEVNIPYTYQNKNLSMSKVMHLKLLRKFSKEDYPLEKLKKYGITSIRGPRLIPKSLSDELNKSNVKTL